MEEQPKTCELCHSPLSVEDKYCPMCREPVAVAKGRLASLKHTSRTKPFFLLFMGILIGTIIVASAYYIPQIIEDPTETGKEALDKGKYIDAVKYFEKALEAKPNSEAALIGKGDALGNLIKNPTCFGDLIKCYEDAIKYNKSGNSIKVLKKMGEIYYIKEEYGEAEECYRKIINSDNGTPKDLADAWLQIGFSLNKRFQLDPNNAQDAENSFDKSISISGNYSDCKIIAANAHYGKGELYYLSGNCTESQKNLRKALKTNPNPSDNDRNKICGLLGACKNTEESEEFYRNNCIYSN